MSGKMTVVYLEHTGHVLAALREAEGGPAPLEALIGAGFPLSSIWTSPVASAVAARFDLPPSVCKSKSVPFDERAIARPQAFVVDGDRVAELPPSTATTVTAVQTAITIVLPTAPGAATKVLSIVRGNTADYNEQRIQAGAFDAGNATVVLNFAVVPSGPEAGLRVGKSCDVATAVAGLPFTYDSVTPA